MAIILYGPNGICAQTPAPAPSFCGSSMKENVANGTNGTCVSLNSRSNTIFLWQTLAVCSSFSKGAFLVKDDRVLKGPLGRSLRLFARTAHSAHSLRSAPLRYARFARSLRSRARSLTSLTPSWDS